MTLLSDLQTGMLLAIRSRYVSTSLWLVLIVLGLALMAAQFSGRQPATIALDVGISAMRLLLPLMIILQIQELLSREFDRRYILSSITYPRSRHWLLLGRFATVVLLSNFLMLLMAVTLMWAITYIGAGYEQATPTDLGLNYLITLAFISVDLFVVTSLATLLAVVASTPSFVLIGTLGFMLAARSYSSIINLLERERYLVENTELYQQSLGILNFLLPDLGSLDVRAISLYGKLDLLPADWLANAIANLAYALSLILLSLFFLNRKRIN